MGEFALIDRILAARIQHGPRPLIGMGDDAAVLGARPDHELVICTDSLNSGIHFLPSGDAAALGHKALAVNLSDLAAMGAERSLDITPSPSSSTTWSAA